MKNGVISVVVFLFAGSVAIAAPPSGSHSYTPPHPTAQPAEKSWLQRTVEAIQSSSESVTKAIRKKVFDASESEMRSIIRRIIAQSTVENLGKAILQEVHSESERRIQDKLKEMYKQAHDALSQEEVHERIKKAVNENELKNEVLKALSDYQKQKKMERKLKQAIRSAALGFAAVGFSKEAGEMMLDAIGRYFGYPREPKNVWEQILEGLKQVPKEKP